MDEADLSAPTPEELSALRKCVAEALANGSTASVKTLLQALIYEIRVDSRDAIHPIFRVPVGGDDPRDDAVRAPSRSVVLRWHDAKPFTQVNGLPVRLSPPNTVIRRGVGDW